MLMLFTSTLMCDFALTYVMGNAGGHEAHWVFFSQSNFPADMNMTGDLDLSHC